MILQVDWKNPIQISSGLQRDKFQMTVLDNQKFFSAETMTGIPEGTSDAIKVPKMLPNDRFTEVYTKATESATSVSTGIMVSNFFMNLLLSGAMGFLWALLNCMQIISHFDLVNILMPANAHYLFKFLV